MFTISKSILSDVLNTLLDAGIKEVEFLTSDNGASIKCVDPANVEMLEITIPKESFVSYDQSAAKSFCFDVDQLKTVISTLKGDIDINIEDTRLKVVSGKSKFELGLIDPTSIKKMPKIPDLKFDNSLQIVPDDINNAISSINSLDNDCSVLFRTEGNVVFVEYAGSGSKASFEISPFVDLKESRVQQSIEYLIDVMKMFKKVSDARIEFSTDYPMKFSGKLGGVSIVWILAPRIDPED